MFGGAGPRVPVEVRHASAETFAQDRGQGAPARRQQPVRAVPGPAAHASRRSWPRRRGLRSADALPVLPADLRRGRGGARAQRRVRQASTASRKPVVHRGAGHDHRLPVDLRGRRMIKMVGYDMAEAAAQTGLRAGRASARGRRGRRAARLLHRQRAAHLRGARPVQGRRGREVHLGRRQHLRRQVSSPTRRAACCRRAIRSARPAWRSAPSWCGSCAARPAQRQVEGAKSRCSTTSASAAPASSRSTRR